MRARLAFFGDFRCAHCQALVSGADLLSGVNHRNHCPYCLWSFHLDLFAAGDRLSACKALMKPIGLTMKRGRNKYRLEGGGELMLVHECIACRTLSINRIAADDDSATLLAAYEESLESDRPLDALCLQHGIVILKAQDLCMVQTQLHGRHAGPPQRSTMSASG